MKRPRTFAKMMSVCARCESPIEVGEAIVKDLAIERWCHAGCVGDPIAMAAPTREQRIDPPEGFAAINQIADPVVRKMLKNEVIGRYGHPATLDNEQRAQAAAWVAAKLQSQLLAGHLAPTKESRT